MEVAGVSFEGPFFHPISVRNTAGVYLIMYRNLVLDVGESTELAMHLANHERQECWIEKGGKEYSIYVHYMPGVRDDERERLGANVRHLLNPRCGER